MSNTPKPSKIVLSDFSYAASIDNWMPTENRILAKRIESSEQTQSGLFIPDKAREKTNLALVVKVNIKKDDMHYDLIKPGCIISYSQYAGVDHVVQGENYISMNVKDLHLVCVSNS